MELQILQKLANRLELRYEFTMYDGKLSLSVRWPDWKPTNGRQECKGLALITGTGVENSESKLLFDAIAWYVDILESSARAYRDNGKQEDLTFHMAHSSTG
jgi:hypothetical protein